MDTGTSWGEPISDAAGTSGWGNTSLGQQASNKPGECFLCHLWGKGLGMGKQLCRSFMFLRAYDLEVRTKLRSALKAVSCYWNAEVLGFFSQPGPKSMQDSWCGDDMPLTGSRQTSWEEEEDVEIGMWNSSSSQEANSSLNWPPYMKKMPTKVMRRLGWGFCTVGISKSWVRTVLPWEGPLSFNLHS